MPTKTITVPRTFHNLDSEEKAIYFALPEHLQEQYVRSLPPLEVTPMQVSDRRRNQVAINEKIRLLEALHAATERRLRELRILWGKLETNQPGDLSLIHHPPQVEGMTIRYERRRKPEAAGDD
jgi:hypothetical protein